jgi:hypothetical protein
MINGWFGGVGIYICNEHKWMQKPKIFISMFASFAELLRVRVTVTDERSKGHVAQLGFCSVLDLHSFYSTPNTFLGI